MKTKPKEKMYFRDINENICKSLDNHLSDAQYEGLNEIALIEAKPNTDSHYIWCLQYGAVDRSHCKKDYCKLYESKSGRGVCANRGKLYSYGNEVTFKIEN